MEAEDCTQTSDNTKDHSVDHVQHSSHRSAVNTKDYSADHIQHSSHQSAVNTKDHSVDHARQSSHQPGATPEAHTEGHLDPEATSAGQVQSDGSYPTPTSPDNHSAPGGRHGSLHSAHGQTSASLSTGASSASINGSSLPTSAHQHKVLVYINAGETLSVRNGDQIQHISGPATVSMVSSNGPPVPTPIQDPPGHMVQQIVDQQGILTHVILSPQPPGVSASGLGSSGGSHHHTHGHHVPSPVPSSHSGQSRPAPHMYAGPPHANCTNHVNSPPPEYRANPPLNSQDDRILKARSRVRKKFMQRHTNTSDGFYPGPPTAGDRNTREGGGAGTPVEPAKLDGQASGKKPSRADDEQKKIVGLLSSMPAPRVTDVGVHSALVQLTAPDYDNTQADLNLQDVSYELLLSNKGRNAAYKSVFSGGELEAKLDDLKPATEYYIKACAVLKDAVKGALTEPVSFSTLPCPPDQPQSPKLMSKTQHSLSLKWNATCENGSKVTAYLLESDQGQADGSFQQVYSGLQRQFRVGQLSASTKYTFRLAAVNSIGQSDFSQPVSFLTSGAAPSQPLPPVLSQQSVYSLTMSWPSQPDQEEFLLQMEDESTGHGFIPVYNGPNLSCVIPKLKKNTEYKFRLAAKNEEGQSKWSEVVVCKTLPDKPQPPRRPQIKGKTGPHTFRVAWAAPEDSGGSQITKYILTLDRGQGFKTVYEGLDEEFVFEQLTPGAIHYVCVACGSAGGTSDFSETLTVTTPPVVPGQCPAPKLQGKPKASSLHLKWSQPEFDGGAQITQFSVQVVSPDNSTREVYKGADTSCMVAGLLPGRPYSFQVRASNKVGAGPWSEPSELVTGAGVPDAPQVPHITCRTASTATVSWQEPAHNGDVISEYRLEYQQKSDTSEFTLIYSGPSQVYEVKGMMPATHYVFRVQAVNSAGAGLFSELASCVTPASSPAAVVVTKIHPEATCALVSWQQPHSNGSDITCYNLAVNDRVAISLGAVTEYLLQDLLPETTYRVRVQAVNSVGAGPFGPTVKLTTRALPPPPPHLECVQAAPGFLKLKWGEGRNSDLLTFTLEMEREDESFQPVYSGSAYTHKVNRLTESTSYTFRITASNDAGNGAYSESYSFSTSKAPPPALKAPRVQNVTLNGCFVEWQSLKPMSEDSVLYVLQLMKVTGTNPEYLQVYQGPDTQFQLDALLPNVDYQLRVAGVRLPADGSGAIQGAFSPPVTVTTRSPVEAVSVSSPTPVQKVETAVKAWTDQQYAAAILILFVVLAVISALVCQVIIGYLHSPGHPTSSPAFPAPSTVVD